MVQKIRVENYTESERQCWDDFVDASNNGTMFHKQVFLDYHEAGKFDFHHLMFYEGDTLVGLMPGGLGNDGRDLWSPRGASYGSIVTADISFAKSLAIVDALIAYGRDAGFHNLYCIPAPLMYQHNFSQHIEYAMLYRRFGFELHYISHAVDISGGRNILPLYDKTARKTVRKVLRERYIEIRESEDYESFYRILLDNKARHNATPTHSLEDLKRLRSLMPEALKLFMVYKNEEPIAGSLLFLCNRKVALCFYNMLLYEYEELKPVYLIMHHVIQWAQANGYQWVDIGVSQVPTAENPMTPAMSLIHFKERFNARGILRSTYHYNLLN